MGNPWEEINLSDYEKHMSLASVFQLQAMNEIMKDQFCSYPVRSVMILGIAGGNGLEHVDKHVLTKVYGVDINRSYLDACSARYPGLQGVLETICADLSKDTAALPQADLLVANLLIEYIGYECFQKAVQRVNPQYVSCVIQVNTGASFVSDSPYIHVFDRLDEVHHQMEEHALDHAMSQLRYKKKARAEKELPNGKRLIRVDFGH